VLTLYTLLTALLTPLAWPLLLGLGLCLPRYRGRIRQRLGLDLPPLPPPSADRPRIWIHTLSVGEFTSALPLIRGVRKRHPGAHIFLTTSTASGQALARERAGSLVNEIAYAPLDLPLATGRMVRRVAPDLFILVETDFWPGWLQQMRRRNTLLLLVNGRFSASSLGAYQRFSALARPMFSLFVLLALQTENDRMGLLRLGVTERRLTVLGNLKYAAALPFFPADGKEALPSPAGPLVVCGSTHQGEEEIILRHWNRILAGVNTARLLIAPRDIHRCDELILLAQGMGLSACRRSQLADGQEVQVVLLDGYGELAAWYGQAAVAFIGGSLVQQGGHNPLEAAAAGIPVLFGPHMEDFSEISQALVKAGNALVIDPPDRLANEIIQLLRNPDRARRMGRAGARLVDRHHEVLARHLDVIDRLLAGRDGELR